MSRTFSSFSGRSRQLSGHSDLNPVLDSNLTNVLNATADALAPFGDMGLEQLSEVLQITNKYRETGELPGVIFEPKVGGRKTRSSTPKTAKASKAPKMTLEDALAKTRDLRSHSQYLDPAQIKSEVQALKVLSVADLKEIQKEILDATPGKNQPDRLASIEQRILSERESKLRNQEILDE